MNNDYLNLTSVTVGISYMAMPLCTTDSIHLLFKHVFCIVLSAKNQYLTLIFEFVRIES